MATIATFTGVRVAAAIPTGGWETGTIGAAKLYGMGSPGLYQRVLLLRMRRGRTRWARRTVLDSSWNSTQGSAAGTIVSQSYRDHHLLGTVRWMTLAEGSIASGPALNDPLWL